MRKITAVAFAVLSLGACGRPAARNGTQIVIPGKDGGALTIGKQMPANLPSYVVLYPGANVTATMDLAGKGGMLGFTTTDSPDAVATFYKGVASKASLDVGMDSTTGEGTSVNRVLTFAQKDTKRSLMVAATVENGLTNVSLTYGEP